MNAIGEWPYRRHGFVRIKERTYPFVIGLFGALSNFFSRMSAWAGIERIRVGSTDKPSTDVFARYPFAMVEREEVDFVDRRFS
jgi:hypothetical protein